MLFCSGGSAGIGKAISEYLNKDGATVCLLARTPEKLEAAKAGMPYPDKCVTVAGDISTAEGVTTGIKNAVSRRQAREVEHKHTNIARLLWQIGLSAPTVDVRTTVRILGPADNRKTCATYPTDTY